MKSVPPVVLTLWMPAFLCGGLFLLLRGMPVGYWSVGIPLVAVLVFTTTLAEVRYGEDHVLIRRWWGSTMLSRTEVVNVSPSILSDIGCLKVRRFIPPFGRVYFVVDWSSHHAPSVAPAFIASWLLGISGFIAARAISADLDSVRIVSGSGRLAALAFAGVLCVLFAMSRRRMAGFANGALFLATFAAGLIRLW